MRVKKIAPVVGPRSESSDRLRDRDCGHCRSRLWRESMPLRRASLLCALSIAFALLAQAPAARAQRMIDLGPISAAECRKPSIMPTSVDEARQRFGCRQMKVVQHWLGTMLDPRSFRATPEQLGDENGPDLHDPDKRRQYFFGKYWSTHVTNNTAPGQSCADECVRAAIAGFDDDLRQS